MDVDSHGDYNAGRNERHEHLMKTNTSAAIEVLEKLTASDKARVLLRLVHLNMPEKFNGLLQRLQCFEATNLKYSIPKSANMLVKRLCVNIQRVLSFKCQLKRQEFIGILTNIESSKLVSSPKFDSGRSACWASFDIFLEHAMDGRQLCLESAIVVLKEAINTLKVLNQASWQETFLALWVSALRLVQRERESLEGPVPHLESRLSVLLSIVPLAISKLLEEEAPMHSSSLHEATESRSTDSSYGHEMDGNGFAAKKHGLISSLQILVQFPELLWPPASVVGAANSAAAKAAAFISNIKNANDVFYMDSGVYSGNMRHLIIEACIARKLLDSSAYLWPGYAPTSVFSPSDFPPLQKSCWLKFMEGAPLDNSIINSLCMTPASSLTEIQKLYHMAVNGSSEESSAAAKILCGASLSHGWNIQEHVVHYVVKLLSPPVPRKFSGSKSHLIDYMPMLSAILSGASSIDTVHILSLHGVIPELAASLMPLCEVFGSLVPTSVHKSRAGDEPSIYIIFSSAFLFLLRLWKFYRPPLEQCIKGGGAARSELALEYLLALHNSRSESHNSMISNRMSANVNMADVAKIKPTYIECYPKLRSWYCLNKSCIASTLSGLCNENPVHQVADKIIKAMYWKMTSGSATSDSTISNSGEDNYPMLPAWELLEAIPFVLEAFLTACAHGRVSSRDLTTGLRNLVDFLPASVAAIISYFTAEVTRGVWKPVTMNGIDWPSPANVLPILESDMKEILAAAGVNIPSFSYGTSPVMLPLPMAALVSLAITFKLDKSLEYIMAVVGPALENCASGCPWPSFSIIGSLWSQKIRRWHNFIVVTCSRAMLIRKKEAVSQLLRSCFISFLGSMNASTSPMTNQSGVKALLGSLVAPPGVRPSLAPGFLFLRSCRTIHSIQFVNDIIIGLVAEYTRVLPMRLPRTDSFRLKSSAASQFVAAAKAREAATLGASLICVAGGMELVKELYLETIPTWLLSSREEKTGEVGSRSCILEGYAMAYMLISAGSYEWGVRAEPPSWAFSIRAQIVGSHMDFLARVLEKNISVGCHPITLKAYVSSLIGLLISRTPAWIQEMKLETLTKLASGLREWQQQKLALSLLERGGIAAFGSVVEIVYAIS
ncbi:mediator of RNA polymerase II transcription subunit 33A-like isoform X2 [Tripterygium wilfordii]|nr:mediator of RNA polymerase II transcription subunit 33A-like isoform X2 [Tripterygium wilfordii]